MNAEQEAEYLAQLQLQLNSDQDDLPNLADMGASFSGLIGRSHKMIFVVNMDLDMKRGKQCAQVAHAALGLYLQVQSSANLSDQQKMNIWMSSGAKKIVVRGDNLEHLMSLKAKALENRLPCHLVTDAGCTQIAPGSKTVLSIFGEEEELDQVTGTLRLL